MNTKQLTGFIRRYLETALWSSVDEKGNPLDCKYLIDDFSIEALRKASKDYEKFSEHCLGIEGLSDLDETDLGHDFWLTRNGHGAGFWDGDYNDVLGEKLTQISKAIGPINIYVSNDEKLHFT